MRQHLTPLLEKARQEGYDQAKKDNEEYRAQLAMSASDEDYERGFIEAQAEAPSRFRWFLAGIITTILTIFIVLYLFSPSLKIISHG